MSLTDRAINNLKTPAEKPYKVSDGGGLQMHVSPSGGKLWRYAYRYNGKQRLLSIGQYPTISLQDARKKRDDAKKLLAAGIDPSLNKQREKQQAAIAAEQTFQRVAEAWLASRAEEWTPDYLKDVTYRLTNNVYGYIGNHPISDLKPIDVLNVIKKIQARGAIDQGKRIMAYCGEIFRFAVANQMAERDVTADLRGALKKKTLKHYACLKTPIEFAGLLRAIDAYQGKFVVVCALRLTPYVFLRPGELRYGEWCEVDFDAAEWRIPAERMKKKEQLIVPLSRQSLTILRELHQATGGQHYMFPGLTHKDRPISENTVNVALRRMGYGEDEMSAHGFRGTASTLLNELGYNKDWIERQMAHAQRDKVRAAYNHADYLADRRVMMQEWADYIDNIRATLLPMQKEPVAQVS